MLGNILEWYEFAIYGSVEPQIARNYFSGSSMAGWLAFAVTFVVRPLGGIILGWAADRFGRRIAVMLSLAGMLIATVGQGLLPSYLCCGSTAGNVGITVFMLFRVVQGLSSGGEIGAISAYLMETSPPQVLGVVMSLVYLTNYFAFIIATFVVTLLSYGGDDFMDAWGWRIPFVISIVPGFIAMWGRNAMPETEEFLKLQEQRGKSVNVEGTAPAETLGAFQEAWLLIRTQFASLLFGFLATVGVAFFWFTGNFWCVSQIKARGMDSTTAEWINVWSQLVGVVFVFVSGMLTDACGIGFATFLGAALLALTSFPVCTLSITMPTNLTVQILCIVVIFGVVYGLSGGTIHLFSAELFPTSTRALGLGLSYNIAVAFLSGFGPSICEALIKLSDLGPPIFMSLMGCVSALGVLIALLLQRQGMIQLTHKRHTPYFRCFGRELAKELDAPQNQKGLQTNGPVEAREESSNESDQVHEI